MAQYPYDQLGTPLDTENLEKTNGNWAKIEADIKSVDSKNSIYNNYITQRVNEQDVKIGNVINDVSQEAFELVVESAIVNRLFEPVASFEELDLVYPNAQNGDAVQTLDDNKTYRFNGENWVFIEQFGVGPFTNVYERLAKQRYFVSVSDFGALGDGVADDTVAIQNAINEGNSLKLPVFIPGGTFKVSTLNIPTFSKIVGSGMGKTTLLALDDNTTVLSVASGARGVRIRDLDISAPTENYGLNNAGIFFADTNGGFEHVLESINIYRFKYGIKCKELFWNNALKDIRINRCDYSFYCNGSNGQSIQNTFKNVYSNEAKTVGFYVSAMVNLQLDSCNFGGRVGSGDATSMYLQIVTNSKVSIVSTNFESIKCPLNGGTVSVSSGSIVSLKDVTFVTNIGNSLTTTHEIIVRDTASVTLERVEQKNSSNMGQINIINTSRLFRIDDSFPGVYHGGGSVSAALSLSQPYLKIARSGKIPLNGSAYEEILLQLPSSGRLVGYKVVYTQATSADVGVTIRLNDSIIGDLFNITTESNKAKFSKNSVSTITRSLIRADVPLVLYCPGGKTGSGEAQVFLEYVLD